MKSIHSTVHVSLGGARAEKHGAARSALLPGSFDPLHEAHIRLAHLAAEMLGRPVAFELSVANVDKPPLSDVEIERRLAQFAGLAEVWLTRASRFIEKAACFPGSTFVVGADTAARVVSARYDDGDTGRRDAALDCLRQAGCSFLVAARADAAGQCWRLEDLDIPAAWRDLFLGIPETRFRLDLSSTELRRKHGRQHLCL
ncbi:MAG: hypothetical protein K2X38_12600 [Gemmataceae bacterium]|nr:hypothetical protein [Gemmataceae bacterium]